jgi:hypothetical protein
MSRRHGNIVDVEEMKKELKSLKRQLARANREIARLQGINDVKEEEVEAVNTKTFVVCPKCASSDIGEIVTPRNKKVLSCKSCKKWRSS